MSVLFNTATHTCSLALPPPQEIITYFSEGAIFQFASLREFSAFRFLIMDVQRLGLQNIFCRIAQLFKIIIVPLKIIILLKNDHTL